MPSKKFAAKIGISEIKSSQLFVTIDLESNFQYFKQRLLASVSEGKIPVVL